MRKSKTYNLQEQFGQKDKTHEKMINHTNHEKIPKKRYRFLK